MPVEKIPHDLFADISMGNGDYRSGGRRLHGAGYRSYDPEDAAIDDQADADGSRFGLSADDAFAGLVTARHQWLAAPVVGCAAGAIVMPAGIRNLTPGLVRGFASSARGA